MGHEIVEMGSFYRNYDKQFKSKQVASLGNAIHNAESKLELVSKEIERIEKVYKQTLLKLNALEEKDISLELIEGSLCCNFYGIYCRLAEALKAVQLRPDDKDDGTSELEEELCKYANRLSLSVVGCKVQVCTNVSLSVVDFKKCSGDDKSALVTFNWESLAVPRIFSAKSPDVQHSVQVFDAEKDSWTELSSKGLRCYKLENFDAKKSYKFRVLIRVKFSDDPKTYTILGEECEHKFDGLTPDLDLLTKVAITEYDPKTKEEELSTESKSGIGKGREYKDISYLSLSGTAYRGKFLKGNNYNVEENGTVYVKTGSDGWNGFCPCDEKLSKSLVTKWYAHIVKSTGNFCILGVVADDYKTKPSNSLWGVLLCESWTVTGSPSSMARLQELSKRIPIDEKCLCLEMNPSEGELSISFGKDLGKFCVVTDKLPKDRNFVPFVMGFNRGDTIEILGDPPNACPFSSPEDSLFSLRPKSSGGLLSSLRNIIKNAKPGDGRQENQEGAQRGENSNEGENVCKLQ